jgi:hypothetical protein
MRSTIIIAALAFLICACDDDGYHPIGQFAVRVVDSGDSRPLAEARLHGGFDWEDFNVTTNSDGVAWLPNFAHEFTTTISRDDYFSIRVENIHSRTYAIGKTPLRLVSLGELHERENIRAIRLRGDMLSTISYQGGYRVYEIGETGITELGAAQFESPVKDFKLFGDTLWYITHDSGVFVYTLEDLFAPRQLRHYDVSGYLLYFDRKDSLVAVGYDDLRLYYCPPDGEARWLASLDMIGIRDAVLISDYLVVIGDYPAAFVKVFDLTDPAHPDLIRDIIYADYDRVFLHGDSVVLGSWEPSEYSGLYDYSVIDLSDPANPQTAYSFTADGRLVDIVDDTLAFGNYIFDGDALTVFRRDAEFDFHAIAIRSHHFYYVEYGGASPPYFIIGRDLCKLTDWP